MVFLKKFCETSHVKLISLFPMAERKKLKGGLTQTTGSRSAAKKMASPNRGLTEQESVFVKCIAEDGLSNVAAVRVAFPESKNPLSYSGKLMARPNIRAAIADRKAAFALTSGMTKKKVIDGFLEAIDMARVQSEPLVMVSGWREIGKMCGFYEPTRAELVVTVEGRRALARLESLPDAELLKLVHEGAEAIDAEFEEITAGIKAAK